MSFPMGLWYQLSILGPARFLHPALAPALQPVADVRAEDARCGLRDLLGAREGRHPPVRSSYLTGSTSEKRE